MGLIDGVSWIGENLYVTSAGQYEGVARDATQAWYNEKEDYTYDSNMCAPGRVCGHYTQVCSYISHYTYYYSQTTFSILGQKDKESGVILTCVASYICSVYGRQQLAGGLSKYVGGNFKQSIKAIWCFNAFLTIISYLCKWPCSQLHKLYRKLHRLILMNAPYSFLPIQEKNVVLLARLIEAYSYGYMYYLHLIIRMWV